MGSRPSAHTPRKASVQSENRESPGETRRARRRCASAPRSRGARRQPQRLNAGRIVLHPFGSTDGPSLGNLPAGPPESRAESRSCATRPRIRLSVPVSLIVPVRPSSPSTPPCRAHRHSVPTRGLEGPSQVSTVLYPSHLHADGVGGYPAGHAVRLLLSLRASVIEKHSAMSVNAGLPDLARSTVRTRTWVDAIIDGQADRARHR